MPQDAYTLRYLCEELKDNLANGKVNKIIEPSADIVVLFVYNGKQTKRLIIDVNPGSPRIGITEEDFSVSEECPNFCMLLRKHLSGATLKDITICEFDRIVKISFLSSPEFCDAEEKTLYVELMGRYSNMILTHDGIVLGGNRGINSFDNGVRPILVGKSYNFPPKQNKKVPSDKSLIEDFFISEENLQDVICKNVQGICKDTAEQISYEFLLKYPTYKDGYDKKSRDFSERFFDFINCFLYSKDIAPCVGLRDGNIDDVFVKPYHGYKHELKYFDSLICAEECYFVNKREKETFIKRRERLSALTNTLIKKAKKRLSNISAKQKDALNAQENKIKGELILSNIYKIKEGQSEVEVENYYTNEKCKIALDARLSPSKNAESYYKKYNKQKRTLIALKPQITSVNEEIEYYESFLDEVVLSENLKDLDALYIEAENSGILKNVQPKKKKKQIAFKYNAYFVKGFVVKAGRSNIENEELTFSSKPDDVWVHVKDYRSSHVIIESEGKTVPMEVIKIACEICAYFSKARNGGKTEVVYTLRKHVKKPPKSKIGFCTYDNYSGMMVIADKHTEYNNFEKI